MARRRKDIPAVDKISWYYRHWKDDHGQLAVEGLKNKDKLPGTFVEDKTWDEWMKDDPRNPMSLQVQAKKEEERKANKEKKKEKKKQQFQAHGPS